MFVLLCVLISVSMLLYVTLFILHIFLQHAGLVKHCIFHKKHASINDTSAQE